MAAGLPFAGLRGRVRDPSLDAVIGPELQRALEVVPLGVGADGVVEVAAARTDVDLAALGRPARLVLARADEVRALLPPAPARAGIAPGDDAGTGAEDPSRPDAAPAAPPRRRPHRRALVAAAALVLLAALAVAVLVARAGDGRDAAAPGAAADTLVDDALPDAVAAALPGRVRRVARDEAVAGACGGRAPAAVVAAPADDGGCGLRRVAEVTVGATVLVAPGGGCVDAGEARRLAAGARAGRPPAQARPVLVRLAPGAPCVAPDVAALRDGRYPLTEVAVLLAPGDAAGTGRAGVLARALERTEETAPVTQLVLPRAPR